MMLKYKLYLLRGIINITAPGPLEVSPVKKVIRNVLLYENLSKT